LLALTQFKSAFLNAAKEGLRENVMSDYKQVNGLMLYHKQTTTHGGQKVSEFTIREVRTYEKFDDNLFAAP
jgi:hypothetical protein